MNERAIRELEQMYMMLSEEKKKAIDEAIKALQAQADDGMREATPEERESVDKYIKSISKPTGVDFWDLEQERCEDAISRQAVLSKKIYTETEEGWSGYTVDADYIEHLPSVRPQEPKTGHWILARTFPTKLYDEYLNEYKCSECYRQIRCSESQLVNYPYCHCGAKMVEPQKRSDKE